MNYLNKDGLSYLWGKITTLLNKKQDTLTAGTGITITDNVISSLGNQGPQGEPGPAGPVGPAGHTPVRGTDYWTENDKTEIVNSVLAALPAAEGVSV